VPNEPDHSAQPVVSRHTFSFQSERTTCLHSRKVSDSSVESAPGEPLFCEGLLARRVPEESNLPPLSPRLPSKPAVLSGTQVSTTTNLVKI
jgi:hypothetical protein